MLISTGKYLKKSNVNISFKRNGCHLQVTLKATCKFKVI